MAYFEITRTRTCKSLFSDEDYCVYDVETIRRPDLDSVREYLKSEYGKCKRVRMFRGDGKPCGYIYCFNTPKATYDDQPKNNQDWVQVRRIEAETITSY